jgi:hypothetical protein
MHARRALAALVLALLVSSCSRDSSRSERAQKTMPSRAEMAPPQSIAPGAPSEVPATFERQLIQTVDLTITVSNTEAAADSAQRLARALGGHVSNVDANRVDDVMNYRVVLRVPAARLDEAVAALRRLASRVESESRGVEDVTDQVIDLDARLRTLRATEKELLALLAESRARARKAEDIMAIYRELTSIRSQIESLDGQRQSIARRVALATVSVSILPTGTAVPVAGTWRPLEVLHGAVRTLVGTLRAIANLGIYVMVVVLPLILGVVAIGWLGRRFLRRGRPPAS